VNPRTDGMRNRQSCMTSLPTLAGPERIESGGSTEEVPMAETDKTQNVTVYREARAKSFDTVP